MSTLSAIEPPPTPQPTDCPSCGRSHDYCSHQSFRGRDACCMTCDEIGRGPNHKALTIPEPCEHDFTPRWEGDDPARWTCAICLAPRAEP